MRTRLLIALFGIFAVLAAVAGVALWNMANVFESFDRTALALQARASNLVEQHTALAIAFGAIVQSGDQDMLQDAIEAIAAAYPRVLSIQSLTGASAGLVAGAAEQYSVITSSGGRAVELTIDASDLLPQDLGDIVANLALPDGTLLVGPLIPDPEFVGILQSASQPLVLSAAPVPALAALLPVWPSAAAAALATLIYGLAIVSWRQWRLARSAERRALHGENLARLEQASRINGLGEMASGIAHELTQPLTAILSQTQAGRRLLARGDVTALAPLLDETITQTKRASAILAKLRQWVRSDSDEPGIISVAEAVGSVASLLRSDLAARRCHLEQVHDDPQLLVRADAVQLEQVVFNLVRNAMEAIAPGPGTITVSSRCAGQHAVIEVADSGPGLDDHVKAHLFEPFVTSKRTGMGLGLALCQRLVERIGGSLDHVADAPTIFRVVLPVAERGS